jgi:hypothetical protein
MRRSHARGAIAAAAHRRNFEKFRYFSADIAEGTMLFQASRTKREK